MLLDRGMKNQKGGSDALQKQNGNDQSNEGSYFTEEAL
jgi:hypothetical protein